MGTPVRVLAAAVGWTTVALFLWTTSIVGAPSAWWSLAPLGAMLIGVPFYSWWKGDEL